MKNLVLTIFVSFFCAQNAWAIEPAESSELREVLRATHTTEPNMLSVLLALVFVIFLIYLTGFIYTKLNKLGAKVAGKKEEDLDISNVKILSTTQLAQDRNLHVIEIKGKHLLIGATSGNVSLIKDLDEKTKEYIISKPENNNDIEINENKDNNIIVENETSEKDIKQEPIEPEVISNKEKEDDFSDEDFGLYKKYLN